MEEADRLLSKPFDYYERAMQNTQKFMISDQVIHQDDFILHVFWYRYMHIDPMNLLKLNSKLHFHSIYEVQFILQGRFEFHDGNPCESTRVLSAGDFVLITPQTKHYFKPLDRCGEMFGMAFDLHLHDTSQGNTLAAQYDSIEYAFSSISESVLRMIELIIDEFGHDQIMDVQMIRLYSIALFTNMTRCVFAQETSPHPIEQLTYPRLLDLEQYVNENIHRSLTVEGLAQHLQISTRRLNQLLHEKYQMSTKQFIDSRRTLQARRMLLETDMTLQQISEALGFANVNQFIRFFKRVEGLPPKKFRVTMG